MQINAYSSVSGPKPSKNKSIYIFQYQICKLIDIYIFQDQNLLANTNICISELYFPLIEFLNITGPKLVKEYALLCIKSLISLYIDPIWTQ